MPENEEKVGFEAYFETKDFEEGIKRFENGLSKADKSSDKFIDKIGELDKTLGGLVGEMLGTAVSGATGVPGLGNIFAAFGESLGISGMLKNVFWPLNVAIKANVAIWKTLGGVIKGVGNIVGTVAKGAFSVFQVALKGALFVVGSLAAAVGGTLVLAFLSLRKTVKSVVSSVMQDLRDTFEIVKTLQSMEVGLEAITRAALVMQGSFNNATEAMDAAVPIADQLLDKLVEISLTSPFSVKDVNVLFRRLTLAPPLVSVIPFLSASVETLLRLPVTAGYSSEIFMSWQTLALIFMLFWIPS